MACDLVRPSEAISIDGLDGGALISGWIAQTRSVKTDQLLGTKANLYSAALALEDQVPPRAEGVVGSLTCRRTDLEHRGSPLPGERYRCRGVPASTAGRRSNSARGGRRRQRRALPGRGTRVGDGVRVRLHRSVPTRVGRADRRSTSTRSESAVIRLRPASRTRPAIGARSIEGSVEVLSDPARRRFDTQGVVGLTNPLGDRPGLVPNGVGASRDATLSAYVRLPAGSGGRGRSRPIRARRRSWDG